MSEPLTQTETQVYHYLIEFLAANSYQPSIREIGRQFEIKSTKTVSDVLGSLARKGYIQRNHSRSRGLRILSAPSAPTRAVPFYATLVEFGAPISPDDRTDSVLLDRRFAASEDAYLVRTADSAMADCGVRRGDLVLVDPAVTPLHGELVAVRVGVEAVVRTLHRESGTVVFATSAKPSAASDAIDSTDGALLGAVCGVFRGSHHAEALAPELVEAA